MLDAGVEKEADSLGLAPTSSTTAALALGDALAVSLMERHHFTADNFAVFHPGGSLGKRLLLTVEMVMHKGEDNPLIDEMASVKDALFVMTDKGLGAVSVTDREGRLLGLMTDGDVRRGLEKGEDFLLLPVRDVMTNSPMVISQQKLAAEALHIMESTCRIRSPCFRSVMRQARRSAWYISPIFCGRGSCDDRRRTGEAHRF